MATTYNKDTFNPVGIGVIGAGNWGQNLVRNYASLPAPSSCTSLT